MDTRLAAKPPSERVSRSTPAGRAGSRSARGTPRGAEVLDLGLVHLLHDHRDVGHGVEVVLEVRVAVGVGALAGGVVLRGEQERVAIAGVGDEAWWCETKRKRNRQRREKTRTLGFLPARRNDAEACRNKRARAESGTGARRATRPRDATSAARLARARRRRHGRGPRATTRLARASVQINSIRRGPIGIVARGPRCNFLRFAWTYRRCWWWNPRCWRSHRTRRGRASRRARHRRPEIGRGIEGRAVSGGVRTSSDRATRDFACRSRDAEGLFSRDNVVGRRPHARTRRASAARSTRAVAERRAFVVSSGAGREVDCRAGTYGEGGEGRAAGGLLGRRGHYSALGQAPRGRGGLGLADEGRVATTAEQRR